MDIHKKEGLLRAVYDSLPSVLKQAYRFVRLYPSYLSWRISRKGKRRTVAKLETLRAARDADTVVIMGNGPSLKSTKWELIRHVPTIGLNRINLLFDEMGFEPTYTICINELMLQQFCDEIASCKRPVFLNWKASNLPEAQRDETFFLPSVLNTEFSEDLGKGWQPGHTVTFAALQLAYFLGYEKVLLIGVDHRFSTQGASAKTVVSSGPDQNHFSPHYFGPGIKWQLPDLQGSERMYAVARNRFESAGRTVLDCTVGGALEVFEKSTLEKELK